MNKTNKKDKRFCEKAHKILAINKSYCIDAIKIYKKEK